jgi:DNA-binding CsgD family transcriptional regulator/tetratricopeptide (TPR) repeat protein
MLVGAPGAVAFRHELARRAWEEALEAGRRTALHAAVFEVLLDRGAEQVGFARLVHHAERAGLGERVLHYAPAAAREAAALGAHREAAAHYATALRYADPLPAAERATLLEAYSFERYLTAEIDEAVRAREAALALRRSLDDRLREGSNLRWLSRVTWFLGERARTMAFGEAAIRVLEPLGSTAELAMAYSNLAQLDMLADKADAAVAWGERAIALAEQLGDMETLTHALNNVGTAQTFTEQRTEGLRRLERALTLALENGFPEHAVRTYSNLASRAMRQREFAEAEAYLDAGLRFAAEHDIVTFALYMTGWRARLYLERGEWDAAALEAEGVLGRYHLLNVVRFPALIVLGRVRARRGEPGALPLLDEARELAAPSEEIQRIGPAAAARAEAAWIAGDLAGAAREARPAYELSLGRSDRWQCGELAYWLWRAGALESAPENIPEPYRLHLEGDWRGAAELWERIGCPYERALALSEGDDPGTHREALELLEQLGARVAAEAVRRDLRGRGVRGVPRGPRPATREHPGGLTRGQSKVLALLALGHSNAEIARQLFLSPRTVDHHVSAILQRLGVRTRAEAIAAAHARNLLPDA